MSHLLSLATITVALLMAGLSLPMIFRRVPMNSFYGARFKAAFQSEENWYEINVYGGKALLLASLPVGLCGALNLCSGHPMEEQSWYRWLAIAVMLVAPLGAAFFTYLKSVRVGEASSLVQEQPKE